MYLSGSRRRSAQEEASFQPEQSLEEEIEDGSCSVYSLAGRLLCVNFLVGVLCILFPGLKRL